jgi:hypothetical protein
MTQAQNQTPQTPPAQYLGAEYVLDTMGRAGARRIRELSAVQILVLAAIGGAFITVGALFSLLLGAGVRSPGPQRLLEGLGFSAGFFFASARRSPAPAPTVTRRIRRIEFRDVLARKPARRGEAPATASARDVAGTEQRRLYAAAARLALLVAIAVGVIALAPGLGDVRHRLAHVGPGWLALA